MYGQRSASSPPWRGFFLRAFILTLDSKSCAPVQSLSEIKLRRKECSRRPPPTCEVGSLGEGRVEKGCVINTKGKAGAFLWAHPRYATKQTWPVQQN